MPRTIVRYYDRNKPGTPRSSAILHTVNCPSVAWHVAIQIGEVVERLDGRWERFATEGETELAAETHHVWRNDATTSVNYTPYCCERRN